MRRSALFVVVAAAIILAGFLRRVSAQSSSADTERPTGDTQSFEVASIKRDPRPGPVSMIMFDGADPGRYTSTNITAKLLIEFAYGVKDFQLIGGPGWIDSEGFDIDAKISDATANQIRNLNHEQQEARKAPMLQSLLTDRFNLKINREIKDSQVYAIVVAKGGPKLTEAPCPPAGTSPPPAPPPARGTDGLPVLPPCEGDFTIRNRVATIRGNAQPISQLASALAPQLRRPVLDQTGLKGTYSFQLQFDLESAPGDMPLPSAPEPDAQSAPSLFSAIQEQLGLRLESTKAPVDVIVIDHIEEPSPN